MAPRKPADTLEPPAAHADEAPDFSDAEKTREERIAELDVRGDRLNGNGHSEVRPSERCTVMAGSGPHAGMRCTFRQAHDSDHSWESTEATSVATSTADSPGEQGTLPGTPEPEQDEYSIPFEGQFNSQDYMAAPGIQEIAERYIGADNDFGHLRGVRIRYLWKRRGGLKGGNPRLAALIKPGGLSAYALGRPQFALWLAADHVREAKLTPQQIDALIYDQLARAVQDDDDHDQLRVAGPDFEGMIATVQRFGIAWLPDLRELGANIKQLNLLDTIDVSENADDQDEDEDE
jgi:hypothetical protein